MISLDFGVKCFDGRVSLILQCVCLSLCVRGRGWFPRGERSGTVC